MTDHTTQGERAPDYAERFVRQMLVAFKAVKLYPPASDIPRESAGDLVEMLRVLLRDRSELRFQVSKDFLLFEGLPVLRGMPAFEGFAREFYNRNLADIRFHAGASAKQIIEFLRILQEPPDVLQATGGFEQRLWDLQVDDITVREVTTKIVDTELSADVETPEQAREPWPPSHERVDDLVVNSYFARPRDQRMLVRFAQNPQLVTSYVRELASSGRGGRPLATLIAGRVVSLAHVVHGELADQPEVLRSIAEGLLDLDPALRRDILADHLLPDARIDEAIAQLLQQFDLLELCRALVEGAGADEVSRDGLARAIRNLSVITTQPREQILTSAEQALRSEGFDASSTTSILENALPARITTPDEQPLPSGDGVEGALRLIDLAPTAALADEADVGAVRDEVADGVSDGDVLIAIMTLVTLERRPEMFASLMAMVEDGLGLLLEWGEYADAAHAAAALDGLALDPSLDESQRVRVANALESMASLGNMRELSAVMRVHKPGSPEHDACRALLETLGAHTIGPLLEVLADEPDMTARKALVDLVVGMAANHIDSLGERTGDPRWYFVRNVVNILGSTRSPEALGHLKGTLRHGDSRVRRETIRAIANVRTRVAEDMLVAALADEDPSNVALAARTLGSLGATEAVGTLATIAQGDGRGGGRDVAARIEAIEALGRLGSARAEEVLHDIARQRMGVRGRARELRTAAATALAELQRAKGGA